MKEKEKERRSKKKKEGERRKIKKKQGEKRRKKGERRGTTEKEAERKREKGKEIIPLLSWVKFQKTPIISPISKLYQLRDWLN